MQWDSWGQLLFSKMMNWELNNDEELEQEFSKQKEEQVQKPKKEMNMVCLRKRKKAVSDGSQETKDWVVELCRAQILSNCNGKPVEACEQKWHDLIDPLRRLLLLLCEEWNVKRNEY